MSVSWPQKRRLIGSKLSRLDGPDKATGRAKYSYDVNQPYYVQSRIGGSIAQQIFGPVDVQLRGDIASLDYRNRAGAVVAAGTRVLTQTVNGMGGVGKTTVAAALAEMQRHALDVVWWVRAEDPATLTGDLAVHEGQVGDVHIYVTADDFKIVDNKLGNLRIDSRMEIAGELRSPRLEGYLGVSTGEINVDEIVDLTGPSTYATEPVNFGTAPTPASEPAPKASVFDRLQMDLQLTVPNDLVVKAGSLQLPDAPIGLGALTVTLGGDLRAMKDPGGRVRMIGAVRTIR